MLAEDIAPNRLARAKLAALELMQRAKSDRLGLVAFAGSAFLQCPLTIDDAAFRQSVEALDVNIIPQGGTAIAEAIETALTAFKEGDNYKVLVLFTDGEDHDSGALEAAEKAAKDGLRIFTIGIGTAEGELLRIKDAQGGSDYIRDEQGNVVKSHLNERLLQQIAGATEGGFYLPLRGAKAIDTLYDQGLAKLPKSQHQEKFVRRYHERYHWPLAVAIVLLLVEMLFPERKREPKAKPACRARPRQPALSGAPALVVLLLALARRRPGLAGQRAARIQGRATTTRRSRNTSSCCKRKSDDPRLHFNAGAAAYRNQQFEEAAKQFNTTLASPDLKLQGLAYYNEGNALYHLGERNPDPKKRTEAWEKALTDYQSTVKLNPQDADAKFNYEFVKRKLEELKQQQQQSQQNKSDQQKNQDQQQQQQNQQQDQQKNEQPATAASPAEPVGTEEGFIPAGAAGAAEETGRAEATAGRQPISGAKGQAAAGAAISRAAEGQGRRKGAGSGCGSGGGPNDAATGAAVVGHAERRRANAARPADRQTRGPQPADQGLVAPSFAELARRVAQTAGWYTTSQWNSVGISGNPSPCPLPIAWGEGGRRPGEGKDPSVSVNWVGPHDAHFRKEAGH